MNAGFCQCKTGFNGSPCKQQYTVWVRKLASCTNVLPIFDRAHRQMYAEITIESESTECYDDGFHVSKLTRVFHTFGAEDVSNT